MPMFFTLSGVSGVLCCCLLFFVYLYAAAAVVVLLLVLEAVATVVVGLVLVVTLPLSIMFQSFASDLEMFFFEVETVTSHDYRSG